jgi:hypothetical protein
MDCGSGTKCFGGKCLACNPSEPASCVSASIKQCASDGSGYQITACAPKTGMIASCSGGTCQYQCAPGTIANGGGCVPCGATGQSCCSGSSCSSGSCSSGYCCLSGQHWNGAACEPDCQPGAPGTCNTNPHRTCRLGQTACPSGCADSTPFADGSGCIMSDNTTMGQCISGTCTKCGYPDDVCCSKEVNDAPGCNPVPGNQVFTCLSNRCVPCGFANQPCCGNPFPPPGQCYGSTTCTQGICMPN